MWYLSLLSPYFCNGCHDLMQKAMNFNDVAIVSVKGNDYRIHFWYMSKNDAISIMHNSNLIDKKCTLYVFLQYIKMSGTTYYQRNRDVILNRAKAYYENNKELLNERAKTDTENYLKMKKIPPPKKKNSIKKIDMTEEKQKCKKHQKNYREAKKQQCKTIDIFLKINEKEYENFMNNINNVDIKK